MIAGKTGKLFRERCYTDVYNFIDRLSVAFVAAIVQFADARIVAGACSAVRVLRCVLSGPHNAQPAAAESEFKCLQALEKRCKLTPDFHA